MKNRRIISAAFFFVLFGVLALLPPLVLVFRFDARIFGIPIETVYIFTLWALLVVGANRLSRILPRDEPSAGKQAGKDQ